MDHNMPARGSIRYEVEWVPDEPPVDDAGEMCPDRCVYHTRHFKRYSNAERFAKTQRDFFGEIRIMKEVYDLNQECADEDPSWNLLEWLEVEMAYIHDIQPWDPVAGSQNG